jgi:hypothetical protein
MREQVQFHGPAHGRVFATSQGVTLMFCSLPANWESANHFRYMFIFGYSTEL